MRLEASREPASPGSMIDQLKFNQSRTPAPYECAGVRLSLAFSFPVASATIRPLSEGLPQGEFELRLRRHSSVGRAKLS